jgi:hypothetical protein
MINELMTENQIKEAIRVSYLNSLLESRDVHQQIVSSILSFKDELKKRSFVCYINYDKPDPNKRHRDYGYCQVKVDMTQGRGKSISPKTLARMISRICDKLPIKRYFDYNTYDNDGKYCSCGFTLKPKYLQQYMAVDNTI